MIELGGNIELVGFKDLDSGSMVILKKMVGNYVKKMNDLTDGFEKLTLTAKNVHTENKFEIHGKAMVAGTPVTSEVTDFNLFFTVDKVLGKICNSMDK